MVTRAEIWNAVLKGFGRRPTSYLLRWSPTWKNPFQLDLKEVFRCETDGEVLSPTTGEPFRRLHGGHRFHNPQRYSFWEFLKVQLRVIQ